MSANHELASRATRVRRVAIGFGAGSMLAVLVVVIPTLVTEDDAATSPPSARPAAGDGRPPAPIPPGEPCADATAVNPAELNSKGRGDGPPVWLPDEAKAGARITAAKLCSGSDQTPVVVMDGNLWVFYEEGYPLEGRSEWLKALVESSGGEVTSINGLEAYVNASEDKAVRHQILLMVPNQPVIVRIQSPHEVPMARLEKLAQALNLSG